MCKFRFRGLSVAVLAVAFISSLWWSVFLCDKKMLDLRSVVSGLLWSADHGKSGSGLWRGSPRERPAHRPPRMVKGLHVVPARYSFEIPLWPATHRQRPPNIDRCIVLPLLPCAYIPRQLGLRINSSKTCIYGDFGFMIVVHHVYAYVLCCDGYLCITLCFQSSWHKCVEFCEIMLPNSLCL